jgi:hypothetical protein
MSASDADVFICYGPPGEALARSIAEGLRTRGFRVFAANPATAAPPDPARLAFIERMPDFVAVLPPASLASLGDRDNAVGGEVAHAVRSRRNVVLVRSAAEVTEAAERALADLFALRASQTVVYDGQRAAESIATIAHRLSSDGTVDERRLMRRSKMLFWMAGLILLAGIGLQEVPRLLERWSSPRLLAPVPPFAVSWVGVGQRFEAGRWVEFPLGPDTPVSRGDRLRVLFAPSADGHAYVVWRAASGAVAVLFPTDTVRGASRVAAGKLYFAPVGTGWLTIDEPPAEGSLYLIAGYDPLHNLEELIEQPEATSSPAARRQLLDNTVGGLLDGRHGATERRRVWTGTLHPIDPSLKWPAGPQAAATTLADGRVVTGRLAEQPGLISTSVEIKLTTR